MVLQLGYSNNNNTNGETYVAWNWLAGGVKVHLEY